GERDLPADATSQLRQRDGRDRRRGAHDARAVHRHRVGRRLRRAAGRAHPRRGTHAEGGAMTSAAAPAVIVEPVPAAVPPGRSLAWWVRALDAVSGIALLLLISIVLFGGFRLRYGELRITAQDAWRPLA